MRKILMIFMFLIGTLCCNAQYWKKVVKEDNFSGEEEIQMRYYSRNGDLVHTGVYGINDSILVFVNLYDKSDARHVYVYEDDVSKYGGEYCVDVCKDGEIKKDVVSLICYSSSVYRSYAMIAIRGITIEELKNGNFISVRYYDKCLKRTETVRISLSGFTSAYNKAPQKIK